MWGQGLETGGPITEASQRAAVQASGGGLPHPTQAAQAKTPENISLRRYRVIGFSYPGSPGGFSESLLSAADRGTPGVLPCSSDPPSPAPPLRFPVLFSLPSTPAPHRRWEPPLFTSPLSRQSYLQEHGRRDDKWINVPAGPGGAACSRTKHISRKLTALKTS